MIPQSPKELVPLFFDKTAKTYDMVVALTTFGKDRCWKKEIVKQMGNAGSILDLACGTGILTRNIAAKFPKSRILGIDLSTSYLEIAERNSSSFPNIAFMHKDAENLNMNEKFDCICSSYIPKYCNPKMLVEQCVSHINPGGRIILHDFTYPKNRLIRHMWNLFFALLNVFGFFVPSWKYPFLELPELIKASNWVENYRQEMGKNNFDVKQQNLTWSTSTILIASCLP